ncbi:MAG: MFS transporter [Prolixibacteraceae bacterium]
MNNYKKPITINEKIIFGMGDIMGGGAQVLVAFFYLRFLTDVIQISPILAGTVVLISKIWDAISDPFMGVISDNTRTKWGRRKPFFFIGFFAMIIAFVFLWMPVSFETTSSKFIYVLLSYLFFSTVFTLMWVPYTSMSSEISIDYKERNNINGIRLFFSQIASLISAVVPLVIVNAFDDIRVGWITMAIVFGLFYSTPYLLMFYKTHERVTLTDDKSKFNWKTFLQPFQIKTFRLLVGIYLFAYITMDIVATVIQYYMYYMVNRKDETDMVIGTLLIVQIFMIPIVVLLSNKYGKATIYRYSLLIWLTGTILLAAYQPEWASWVIYAIAGVIGIGIGGCVVLPWSMFPDVTDVGELKFKYRTAGTFSGVMTFLRKFSAAIGIFIVGAVLQFAGYLKPVKEMVEGKLTETVQVQPESVIIALKGIVLIFPLILLIPAYFVAKKYPLDKETHENLKKHLEFKRGELEVDNLSPKELKDLETKLI